VAIPLLVYVVLVLLGATYSSLSLDVLRQDPAHPLGTTWGEPNSVRSDEFLTQTSIELNVLAEGRSTHSPLAQGSDIIFQQSSGQVFESVLFLDSTLLRLGPWLPDTMLFAAWRLLPALLLALALPPLLRRFGASRPLSWLGYALVVLAPTSLWWSFTPVRILAYATTGSLLLVLARERLDRADTRTRRALALGLAALGGLVLARLGTYYVPWSVTMGVPVVLATVAYLLWARTPRRPSLLVLATGAGVGAVLLGLTFWENADALRANLDTVYPGQRRSTGVQLPVYHLFGAPGLAVMHDGAGPVVANAAEIASAFLVCGVWALALAGRLRPEDDPARRAATWVLGSFTLLWTLWAAVNWGTLGESLPLLNLVTGPRAAQTVGFIAAMLLCVVLSRLERGGWRVALPAALACAAATAYGVSSLQEALPEITTTRVFVTALVVGGLVLVVTWWRHWAAVLAVVAVLVGTGWWVNPVTFGLGDLRASGAAAKARAIGERAEREGTYVASDDPYVSALLVSNGVPSLTGYQPSGPDADAWRVVDPDGTQEEAWNRGASYLRMSFGGEKGSDPVVDAPNPDIVNLTVDPCHTPDGLGLGRIVTRAELDRSCLEQETTLQWQGATYRVYRVRS
jgi:hypothetical protein